MIFALLLVDGVLNLLCVRSVLMGITYRVLVVCLASILVRSV